MQEYWKKFKNQFQSLWEKLVRWQKIAIIAGLASALMVLITIILLNTHKEYGVLFSHLSEQDASAILQKLKEEKVPYQLRNEGATILIPKELVYEKRLVFAAEGLPENGVVGYEIFDKNNIGLTDFVQKLNYKRALEGELSRTIQSFDEILNARVHIMIPEPTLFTEKEKPATASVVVNLAPGKHLKADQVEGIANLVAASVEGLDVDRVTVINSHGKVISSQKNRNHLIELTASQLDLQERVESYFEEKLSGILTGLVGPNNFIVRVTAELDFNQVERTSESYDPESSAVRSQESDVQSGSDPNNPSKSQNVITNYEISKTVERVVGGVGTIKRLSVAVLVNGNYQTTTSPEGEEVTEYVPRSEEEIQKISTLVKNAIGYDAKRNDQVEVTNLAFDLTESTKQQDYFKQVERQEFIKKLAIRLSTVLAALALFFLVSSIFSRLKPTLPEPETFEEQELEELEIEPETKLRMHRRRMINEIAKDKPDEVARLVKSWLINVESDEWNLRN